MSKKTDTLAIARNSTSKDFHRLNPHVFGGITATDFASKLIPSLVPKKSGKRRKEMNKTESEFARILDAKVARNEIMSWEYESMTLRWPDGMRYTADFCVLEWIDKSGSLSLPLIILIEVKGAYAWAKDIVKFRAARDKWGDRFKFEFWQKIDGEWKETR